MYIGRTRLIQTSTATVIDQWPSFVRTRADVLSLLNTPTRNQVQANPGDYRIDYRLACYYTMRVVGLERATRHLVLEYAVWRTKASADAGDAPDLRNTHRFQVVPGMFAGMTGAEKRGWLREHIEAFIERASQRDATGDERHQVIQLAGDDPDAVLTDLVPLDNAAVDWP